MPKPAVPDRRLTLLHTLFMVLTALALLAPARADPARRQVLVLYSLGSDASSVWQRLLNRGITEELGASPASADVFDERLDVVRTGEAAAYAAMGPYLAAKYADTPLDAVVAENYHASRFLSQHPALFPGVPRFYVNHGRHGWLPDDGTGFEIRFDYAAAIAAIPATLPGVRRIVVVADGSTRGLEWVAGVREVARAYQGSIAFEFWDNLSFAQLYQQAGKLGKDSAIFMFPIYGDGRGQTSAPAVVARTLAASASVPVYSYVDSLIVPGVAGGHVISGARVGRAIGRLILGHDSHLNDVQRSVYDYQVARRFGLEPGPDVEWLNRAPGVWEQYRWHIVGAVALMLVQAALIAQLLLALRARRRATVTLDRERGELEQRVQQRTRDLQLANQQLEQQVTTDALTGIGNRRRMMAQLGAEVERARRFGHPMALLMIDIDLFNDLNSRFGHDAGDRAIIAVAMALTIELRSSDLAARFGGEEFVVLMPETDLPVATAAAERLRLAIARLALYGDQGQATHVTVSVGVATLDSGEQQDSASTLLSRVHQALRRAKAAGRNRVEVAGRRQ